MIVRAPKGLPEPAIEARPAAVPARGG
jgi:hypothetical protein